jgi:hypothetical protein
MIDIDKVIREVAKRLNVDKDIVDTVCKHAFKETVETMKSDDDCRDILFNQLFKFKLKRRYKEDKTYKYSSK